MDDAAGDTATPTSAGDVQSAEVRVPDRLDSVPAARAFLTRLLDGWGVEDEVIDDASLLTSELMTNAVKHGSGIVNLRVEAEDGVIHVSVRDDADDVPVLDEADLTSTGGRGLWIVQSIAHDWGTSSEDEDAGKTVWFELRTLNELRG